MPVNRAAFLASLTLGASGPGLLSQATLEDQAKAGTYRHRQVFAVQRVSNGAVFTSIANSLDAYEVAWGEGPGTLHAAAVFYGTAVAMALDDGAWDSHPIRGVLASAGDPVIPAGRPGGNPFNAPGAPRSIGALLRRGVSFYACNNALVGLAQAVAHRSGNDEQSIYASLRDHLLPRVALVPAGVAVINALQEQRYTLFQSL